MHKLVRIFLLVSILLLAVPNTAFAQPEMTIGCPVGFEPHELMTQHDHVGDMHPHVGTSVDQNGDGMICVKHTKPQIHVHIDNRIPVK